MTTGTSTSRIPLVLQAVFLASNRGKEVTKAPPDKVASKTYTRNWMFQGLRSGTKRKAKREDRLQKVVQFGGAKQQESDATTTDSPTFSTTSNTGSSPIQIINSTPPLKTQKVCLRLISLIVWG